MKPDIAVIDIGSNSVRLMLGAVGNGRVRRLSKTLNTTRLARGVDATGELQQDRIADTIDAIRDFYETAKGCGVPVVAYATSAVRDAENRDAFVKQVLEQTGVRVRVLSGEEEGKFAFSAVTGGEGTVFDIGGGSFQIVTKERALSFPCGCVRAKEQCDSQDPETLERELFAWIDGRGCVPETVPMPVYGVGGTISTIGAMLAKQEQYDPMGLKRIERNELDYLILQLSKVPEPVRKQIPMLSRRYDVILQGGTILKYLMDRTHTTCVLPSDRDGMEGIAEAYLRGETEEGTV